jgi:hypothetical protein
VRFMNAYDIEAAIHRYHSGEQPNRLKAARVVARLAQWTDSNSDGWAYWPKPSRSAARLMALIDGATRADREAMLVTDATDAELVAALKPVKAFLTRHDVNQTSRDLILYPVRH